MSGLLTSQAWDAYRNSNYAQAELSCRQALSANPSDGEALGLLGILADMVGRSQDAVGFLRAATERHPRKALFWRHLGSALYGNKATHEAIDAFRRAIDIDPSDAAAHYNLGQMLTELGQVEPAIVCLRKVVELAPTFTMGWSKLLYTMAFLTGPNIAQTLYDEHRKWGRRFANSVVPLPARPLSTHDQPLRIGYVSPDFRQHAVSRFFEPLLRGHDRGRFRIYLYSECPKPDSTTERLRAFGDEWRMIWKKSAHEVANMVQADHIDILVDLTGHTPNNRLDVFALKPAPIQASYLGYPSITGLPRIDWRITDHVLEPIGENEEREEWGERSMRLPGSAFAFQAPESNLEVSPPPCQRNGYVTLGAHHALVKYHESLLETWGEILRRAPQARLLVSRNNLVGKTAAEFASKLERAGIPRERYEIRGSGEHWNDGLRHFQDIDLILDSFPYSGQTTTCEALWLGVPVLTLRGNHTITRLSASILTALGLEDLVAESVEDYIQMAVEWIQEPSILIQMRACLRNLVLWNLSDEKAFARKMEDAYRRMVEEKRSAQCHPI